MSCFTVLVRVGVDTGSQAFTCVVILQLVKKYIFQSPVPVTQ